MILAPLYFAKLIASMISEVLKPTLSVPALRDIIFDPGLIPAIPIPLFVLAQMMPAICVP